MNSKETFKGILLDCLESLGTPLALSLHIRYESDTLDSLPGITPLMYNNPIDFYKDAQAIALFSKNESFAIKSEAQLEREAKEDFFLVEAANHRLNNEWPVTLKNNQELIDKVKRQIFKIIGPSPTKQFFDMQSPIFGPGATSSCRGSDTTLLHKLQATPECTSQAIDIIEMLTRGCISRPLDYVIVDYNSFFTVPKNYKVRRQCCIEPHLNTWCQRALGLDLKRCLKRQNYDLDNIPDWNKYLLKYHSMDIATLDLKQASDRIYYRFVKEVLPPVWFDFLNRARSHYTKVDDVVHKNDKFSSMGNGFTFELETILFLGIVRAIVPKEHWGLCSVFGDDIMVPRPFGDEVGSALSNLGFVLNEDKTFLSGVFKESCGVDIWWDNSHPLCVRPVYLRKFPDVKKPKELIAFANLIRRIALRAFAGTPKGVIFGSAYKRAIELIPPGFRIKGSDPHYHEDLYLDVPLYVKHSMFSEGTLFSIRERFSPRLKPVDENGWLHADCKRATARVIEVPKYKVKPASFAGRTQLLYALSGGDSEGCVSRNTPTITIIENI